MSDKVKIIIEIPKEMHEALLNGYEEPYSRMFSDVVKNGTPLDTVKAEIFDKSIKDASGEGFIFLGRLLRIFDNIGKEECKDPNDLTHMFDGVTEIPKDAFKGWTTEKLLEQIRKENNDNPEDTGCDHND